MDKFKYETLRAKVATLNPNLVLHRYIEELVKTYIHEDFTKVSIEIAGYSFTAVIKSPKDFYVKDVESIIQAFMLVTYAITKLKSRRKVKRKILDTLKEVTDYLHRIHEVVPLDIEDVLKHYNEYVEFKVDTIADFLLLDKLIVNPTELNIGIYLSYYLSGMRELITDNRKRVAHYYVSKLLPDSNILPYLVAKEMYTTLESQLAAAYDIAKIIVEMHEIELDKKSPS